MKQDAFETLCRRLVEKFIAPNLIPQVGPTGGGDGKTDADTYPVANAIAERWFVPENGWNKDENWAFAVSAKQEWKGKITADVKKIIDTNRGYTKIFFLTNQLISSKKKKDTQHELKKLHKVEVIILDGEWIIEKIYNNGLINLAVDALNLSEVYKNEKVKVGQNDAGRLKRLEELEEKISNPNRYFEYDHQLVEDALEAAILSRMLERSKNEVIGKFERALRLAKKVNSRPQLLRIHYQMAWTHVNWYNAYVDFITSFKAFKEYAQEDINVYSIELYYTMISMLRNISIAPDVGAAIRDIKPDEEENEYRKILEQCIADRSKPSTALLADTFRSFLNLFHQLTDGNKVDEQLLELKKLLQESKGYLEYPFETFKSMIEVYGENLPDNKAYDQLLDCVAEISERRASELAAAHLFLKRGYQKLEKKYYKDSLIYFGKSVMKLAKEESRDYLYFALRGLSNAYEHLSLYWAAGNCIIAAASITLKDWSIEGRPSRRFFNCVKDGLIRELFVGRLPYLLCWHELYQVISPQFEVGSKEDGDLRTEVLADGCLSVRLLNTPFPRWQGFSALPDILEQQKLWMSQDTTLYTLGHTDLIETRMIKDGRTIDDHYKMMANQPFREQIIYPTNLLDGEQITFETIVLGARLTFQFGSNKEHALIAEMSIAFLESFLATSFGEVFPSAERITIYIEESAKLDWYEIIEGDDSSTYTLRLNSTSKDKNSNKHIYELLIDLTAKVLYKNFIFKGAEDHLKTLYEKDELHERLSMIVEHRKFFTNLFGNSPKIFISDWIHENKTTLYESKRSSDPLRANQIMGTEESKTKAAPRTIINNDSHQVLDNVKHNQTRVSSVIDGSLWDKAHWTGFGFFSSLEVPLGIFIAFEDGAAARKIFENWIQKFGKVDQQEEIKISIVKGVSKSNPHWYRVQVSKRFDIENMQDGQFMVSPSRFHKMEPVNANNLTNLINGFNYFGKYSLFPASFKQDRTIDIMPYLDLGILKTKLMIKEAWEIGEQDLERVVILEDDDPIIPANQPDAPVLSLLKQKRS